MVLDIINLKERVIVILKTYQQNRLGWTMIELIFVIILIGILASIAVGKLAVTRDDAKLSTDISNMSICLRDANTHYLSKFSHLASGDSTTCNSVKCYIITYATSSDPNFKIEINTTAPFYCGDVEAVGGHLVGTYQLSGTKIKK